MSLNFALFAFWFCGVWQRRNNKSPSAPIRVQVVDGTLWIRRNVVSLIHSLVDDQGAFMYQFSLNHLINHSSDAGGFTGGTPLPGFRMDLCE